MKKSLIVLGLCAAATMFAQGPPPGRGPGGRMGPGGPGGPGGMMMGMGPGMGRTVTGAPFSAVEVRESTQTLPNGNVITQKAQSNVYRDSMGRQRTETTMPAHQGPAAATASAPARIMVSIHDPVAGVNRELDSQAKTVREMPLAGGRGRGGPNPAAGERRPPNEVRGPNGAADPNVATETLAMQTINGVQANGTRVTRTIPAGQIGNAQPILIVHETWTSVDLKIPVMIKMTDPRTGTTTTQLTSITRSEPDPSLFQAPSDYTVTKGGRGPGGMRGPQGNGAGGIIN
jgi:hypothetical protein